MTDMPGELTKDEVGAVCTALNWSLTHPDELAIPFESDGLLYEIAPSAEDIRKSLRLFSAMYRQLCEGDRANDTTQNGRADDTSHTPDGR